jgi:hypothetical protein
MLIYRFLEFIPKKNTTKLKQLNIPLYLNKTKSPGDENHHIFPQRIGSFDPSGVLISILVGNNDNTLGTKLSKCLGNMS